MGTWYYYNMYYNIIMHYVYRYAPKYASHEKAMSSIKIE